MYCAELHVLLAAVSSSLDVQLGFRLLLLCLPCPLPSMSAAIFASLYPRRAATFSPTSPALSAILPFAETAAPQGHRLRVNKLTL